MSTDKAKDHCTDPTQELSVKIPCRLVERIEAHAKDTGADITGIIIEALDIFLREHQSR